MLQRADSPHTLAYVNVQNVCDEFSCAIKKRILLQVSRFTCTQCQGILLHFLACRLGNWLCEDGHRGMLEVTMVPAGAAVHLRALPLLPLQPVWLHQGQSHPAQGTHLCNPP
jgi:hypothetical protein